MKRLVSFLFVILLSVNLSAQEKIEDFLDSIDGITYEKLTPLKGYTSSFKIKIEQPVDHNNPEGEKFFQKVYLNHKSSELPVVMVTEGYMAPYNYLAEPTELIGGNEIIVEHRYFGESIPEEDNWKFLNTRQAADDHKNIVELFKEFYSGKWISTGVSKGGQTTLFLKYYYPDLVDVSIPYVAPITIMQEDPRIHLFLEMVGDKECREKIKQFQITALKHSDSLKILVDKFIDSQNLHFTIMKPEIAIEYTIMEYPFSFWQWGYVKCENIPDESATAASVFAHLQMLINFRTYSDEALEPFIPFYVQAYNEIGYYNYDITYLKPYLKYTQDATNEVLVPAQYTPDYDNTLMFNVINYLEHEANNVLYIYGELDTWSACQVPVTGLTNSVKFLQEGGHHTANIRSLSDKQKKIASEKLSEWLDDTIIIE